MAAKKWVCALLLTYIFVGLSVKLFVGEQPFLTGEVTRLKNTVLVMLGGGRPSNNDKVTGHIVLSPNLSSCHQSFGKPDYPVNCCPPKRESEEPFIEFQFPSSSLPLRVRRPAHAVDDEYISKYNKALTIMKSLPYDDPRSFMRQADMHCIYCTGAYNQLHSNTPLNIHRSWLFYPWHRMMIFFHERILGKLIGDDTFALPFWNWDSPSGMFIPDMYMNGSFVHVARDASHFPPNISELNFNGVDSGLGAEEQISTNLAFMYTQMVSGAKKIELFMGCPLKAGEEGNCSSPGTIEKAPHNTLHTWIGSNLVPDREDMGVFYSAARDPIFYAHHSNIDRLWEVWKELGGYSYKREINDSEWLDSYFFFHDENAQLVRIRIQDVLDITKLRYSYEKVDHPWLNARPQPSVSPKIARYMLKMRDDKNSLQLPSQIESADFQHEDRTRTQTQTRTLDTTVRVKVYRPKTSRTKEEKEEEEEVLVVYGINVKDAYVKFDIYVNAVDETRIGPESREFAGNFVNVQGGVSFDAVTKRKSDLKLGISELLEDLEADGDESIWVSLVPRGGTTTFDGIRIEYIA